MALLQLLVILLLLLLSFVESSTNHILDFYINKLLISTVLRHVSHQLGRFEDNILIAPYVFESGWYLYKFLIIEKCLDAWRIHFSFLRKFELLCSVGFPERNTKHQILPKFSSVNREGYFVYANTLNINTHTAT